MENDYGKSLVKKAKVIYVNDQTKIQYKISVIMCDIAEGDLYSFRRRIALVTEGVLFGQGVGDAEINFTNPENGDFMLEITFKEVMDTRRLGIISSYIVDAINASEEIGDIHFHHIPYKLIQMEL